MSDSVEPKTYHAWRVDFSNEISKVYVAENIDHASYLAQLDTGWTILQISRIKRNVCLGPIPEPGPLPLLDVLRQLAENSWYGPVEIDAASSEYVIKSMEGEEIARFSAPGSGVNSVPENIPDCFTASGDPGAGIMLAVSTSTGQAARLADSDKLANYLKTMFQAFAVKNGLEMP
jgi:hypothetical protein